MFFCFVVIALCVFVYVHAYACLCVCVCVSLSKTDSQVVALTGQYYSGEGVGTKLIDLLPASTSCAGINPWQSMPFLTLVSCAAYSLVMPGPMRSMNDSGNTADQLHCSIPREFALFLTLKQTKSTTATRAGCGCTCLWSQHLRDRSRRIKSGMA